MLAFLVRAIADLRAPALRRVVVLGLAIAAGCFALLWLGLGWLLHARLLSDWTVVNWVVQLLGAAAVLGLSWLLFPGLATLVMGLFLDRVAAEVERLDYPGSPPARRQSLREIIGAGLRLGGLTLLLNLLALPLYLMVPGLNFFVFLGLNGYLFGRGYFEVAALRRLDINATRAVRRRFALRVFAGGVLIAGLFAVPLVNLAAPVIATAYMVHLFESLPPFEPQPLLV